MQKTENSSDSRIFNRVLITRFSALGDIAMTIPVVYSVCMANPSVQFMMVTQKIAASLYINSPNNLTVKGIVKEDYHGVIGLFRLFRELKKEFNPDAFVDLHSVIRSIILGIFFTLSGVKYKRIDKGRRGKYALTRPKNKHKFPLISSRARYREVFNRIGFNCKDLFVSIFGGKPADNSLFSEIFAPHQKDEIWIAIAPFAKHKGKIYPLDKMEKVIEKISGKPGYKQFLFGSGNKEKEILAKWEEKYPNALSMAKEKHGFLKELALLSNCNAMISMDSANMHLASLVNLPVVSIWGATHPYCGFMGWRQDEKNAVQLDIECRPCSVFGNKPCRRGDYKCLNDISLEMIMLTLERTITKSKQNNE
ncbi:MAG: glycosyltransferase family 9 protein [Muribaculaceae bacterium]|nr:glycosyltransferase family 9 protein [Muribaculaceae bacterium]